MARLFSSNVVYRKSEHTTHEDRPGSMISALHVHSLRSGKAALRAEYAPEGSLRHGGGARKGGMTRTDVRRLLVPTRQNRHLKPSPSLLRRERTVSTPCVQRKGEVGRESRDKRKGGEPKPAPPRATQAVSPPRRRPSRSCPSCPARERAMQVSHPRRPRPRSGAAGSLRSRRPRPDTGWRGCPRS